MQRADKELVDMGLAPSRQKAQYWIKSGFVFSQGKQILKPSLLVESGSLHLTTIPKDVGRGAIKLRYALQVFNISANDSICLDIGASSGGFTQVWIESGAKKVYAVDVGTDQLHPDLKKNSHVISMEQCNFRTLDHSKLDSLSNRCSIDVSFVSSTLILERLKPFLTFDAKIILLIKPQFEVEKKWIHKGIVKKESARQFAINKVLSYAEEAGFAFQGLETSPIVGGKGNIEYLAYLSVI